MYNLTRFLIAHEQDFPAALSEIRSGRKRSHWMWYIFPQYKGLGQSWTSTHYAIQSLEEAIAFLNDPYLGSNLRQITQALLDLDQNNPTLIFGRPDDMKLRSSMTLFACADPYEPLFQKVIDRYFAGRMDERTLSLLERDAR